MADSVSSVLRELEALGNPQTKKILLRHGVSEPFFGVKVGDMKPIVKRIKKNHDLSLGLFATGNADAQYFAGLIADEKRISDSDLESWLKAATSQNVIEYTIPWVASESAHGWQLGLKWIDVSDAKTQGAGWATLANWTSIRPDAELDIPTLRALIERVEREIHGAANRVKYSMNMFLITVGSFVTALTADAIAAGNQIGPVDVNMNGTACAVPDVASYIAKVEKAGGLGKKKKQARC